MNRLFQRMLELGVATALLLGSLFAPIALAQSFPSQPVRLIVPFPPGGSTDVLARLLAQHLSKQWGKQ
ncbi:MAG: tripartite tricarboxylate transporter substrate binding protein, partial [Pigmentiphaga sp.]